MKISSLRQALCSDRSQITNDPDPGRWFSGNALPPGWAVYSFHFFVNWNCEPPLLGDTFLTTLLVDFEGAETPYSVTGQSVLQAYVDSELPSRFEVLKSVCSTYSRKLLGVLLPECESSTLCKKTPFWMVRSDENGELSLTTSTLSGLKRAIQNHSGGPISIGDKGLTHGTSAVECYLSLTDGVYPGDVDAIVVDEQGNVRSVIEFKKDTKGGPFGNRLVNLCYYPKPDGRKYRRLHALVSEFRKHTHSEVPLIILYFSTKQPLLRIQSVGTLTEQMMEILRDSKDIGISGMNDTQIANKIAAWIGIWG